MRDGMDRDLALRARDGEGDAFGELVRRYQASVFNVCVRLLGDRAAAEDLAQEAFIRAYERLASFDVDRPFGPWMRRVAANLCLNRLESGRGRAGIVSLDDERDRAGHALSEHDPAGLHEQAEAGAELRAAILALPPRYRAVIELRHFQEMSYADIADALDIPLSDVKSHLFRARKMLARSLRSYAYVP